MWKFLSVSTLLFVFAGAFDYNGFYEKYCYEDTNVMITWSYMPYDGLGERKAPKSLICENFVITKNDLESMAESDLQFTFTTVTLVLRSCEIEYLNEVFLSKIGDVNWLHFDNCSLGLQAPSVKANFSVSNVLWTLGFHDCYIYNNHNTDAFHKLNSVTNFLFQDCNFEYPGIDSNFLPKVEDLKEFLMDSVNVNHFGRGFLKEVSQPLYSITCTSCNLKEINSLFDNMNQDVEHLLSFADNFITKLPTSMDILSDIRSLQILNMSSNRIVEPLIRRNYFKNLKSLRILDLSDNVEIKAISRLAFKDLPLEVLKMSNVNLRSLRKLGCVKVSEIDLSVNNISNIGLDVLEELSNLTHLDLSRNILSDLDEAVFKGLISLETLRLSYNNLKMIPAGLFDGLESLKVLDLRSNYLERLEGFDTLTSLQELHISDNYIKIIPSGPSLPSSLLLLNISMNPILSLGSKTFSNVGSLITLDMSSTLQSFSKFHKNTLEHLRSLQVLLMRKNHIDTIEGILFPDTLVRLDLSVNKLNTISNNIFDDLANLKYLNVSRNQLNVKQEDFTYKFPQIRYVDFSGN